MSAATTCSLPATTAAMGVMSITLIGSFGPEHCSSGLIHVIDHVCGIGPIQDYATNVLGVSSPHPRSHLSNSDFLVVYLCSCPALPYLLQGEPLMGAHVKLEMQCACNSVESGGCGGWFIGLEVQPICPYSGSTGMPILLRVVNSQSQ